MRIIECYIENFGKLCKQKFDFDKGLNCINGENGMGKTTLAAFIKAMLYGFNDTKKASLEENDRKHYLPWQGGLCGGSLTFSIENKTYRIERSFGAKAADDTLTVYDTSNGRVCLDFGDNPGESIFGIDADGFERTVYLSERALTPRSDNKSISAKLSDLVGCDGDIGGMDDAMKIIEEQRKFYYKKGGAGQLANTEKRISDIKRSLDALSETEIALESTQREIKSISRQLEEARETETVILKEREALSIKAAGSDAGRPIAALKKELEQAKEKESGIKEIFGSNIPSFEEIDEASYMATERKSLLNTSPESPEERKYNALKSKFDGKVEKSHIESARSVLARLSEIRSKENDPTLLRARRVFARRVPEESEIENIRLLLNKSAAFPTAIVFYILFAIVGVLGIILEPIVAIIGLVGIVLTAVIDISINGNAKKRSDKMISEFFKSLSDTDVKDKDEAKERLADMTRLLPIIKEAGEGGGKDDLMAETKWLSDTFGGQAVEEIIREYDEYTQLAIAYRYISADREARIERARKLEDRLAEFTKRFNTKTSDIFGELRAALTEYNGLRAFINARSEELNALTEKAKASESEEQDAKEKLLLLDGRRKANADRIAELSRQLTLKERAYNSYADELEGRDLLYMMKAELEEKQKKDTDNYNTLLLTKKYITAAKDNMTAKYLGKTKEGFLKYTECIGGITGESFEMDTDFGVTKQEGASTRSVEAYSRGTRDLFNLAARLALVDSLYEGEKPFIILDDPFTALDDGKTEAALKLLREFAKERQIIYFTCSNARSI